MKYVFLGLLFLVFSIFIIYFIPIHKEVFSTGELVDKTQHVDGEFKFLLDVDGDLVITKIQESDFNKIQPQDSLSYYKSKNAFGIEIGGGIFVNQIEGNEND